MNQDLVPIHCFSGDPAIRGISRIEVVGVSHLVGSPKSKLAMNVVRMCDSCSGDVA